MITYLSIYFYLAIISLSEIKLSEDTKKSYFLLLFIFILLFISGRYNVGGDYVSYIDIFEEAKENPDAFDKLQGLTYVIQFIHKLNLSYFFFNFTCSLIFLAGIFKFLNISNERLFVFILLIPTMIYVVGMGYTRQSVSIGLLCFAIYYWSENMNLKKYIFFILSVYIHISSIIFIFLLFHKSYEKIRISKLFLLTFFTTSILFLFYHLYFGSFDNLSSAIGLEYKIIENSPLKFLKFLAHIVPILVFLIFRKKFNKDKKIYPLYFFFIASTVSVIILMFVFKGLAEQSSYIDVIADRVLLPFLLIEALIFVRLYSLINLEYKFLFKILILFYFGLQLFVWLLFADNSFAWQPYRSIFFLEW